MVCFHCRSRLFVTSVWFDKQKKYQYSYICFYINSNCKEFKVKFRYESEINTCEKFQLTLQGNGNGI